MAPAMSQELTLMVAQDDSNKRQETLGILYIRLPLRTGGHGPDSLERSSFAYSVDINASLIKPSPESFRGSARKMLTARSFKTEMQRSMDRLLKWRNFIGVFGILVLGAGLALLVLHCVVKVQHRRNHAICRRRSGEDTKQLRPALVYSKSQSGLNSASSPQVDAAGDDLESGQHNSSPTDVPARSYDHPNDERWVYKSFKAPGHRIQTSMVTKPPKVYIPPWLSKYKHEQPIPGSEGVEVLGPRCINPLATVRPRGPVIDTTIFEELEPAETPDQRDPVTPSSVLA